MNSPGGPKPARKAGLRTAAGKGTGSSLRIGVFGGRGIPSTYSGYETFLTALLPELVRRGHRVTMYCRRGESEVGDYQGVTRVGLPAIPTKELSTLSHGALAALVSRFGRHDVVFTVNVANAAFALMLKVSGQRVAMNTDGQEWLRGKWGTAAKTYFKLSAHMAGLSASALIADCVEMRRIYRDQFASDSTVIPYCWSPPEHDGGRALDDFGLRGPYFLCAGRLNPENNVERVVASYLESGASPPLVVLGVANYDSPVARRLAAVAEREPRIRPLGHIGDRAAYATLVGRATAYVHAHSVGGINPSLIEAMGCGARILALATPFNREALGGTGLCFEDFTDLARLFAELDGAHGVEPEGVRAMAQARAETTFSLAAVADAYEDLFSAMVENPSWHRTVVPTMWAAASESRMAQR